MASLLDLSARFRADLLRLERKAAGEIVRAYLVSYKRIKSELDSVLLKISVARSANESITPAWLFQQRRLSSLLEQIDVEMRIFSAKASGVISEQQRIAIDKSLTESVDLISAALGEAPEGLSISFTRLPKEAFESLVGNLGSGSPLEKLLGQLGPAATRAVQDGLIAGLAAGKSVRQIAKDIKFALGGNMERALKISRTEILRAYRQASIQTYRANSDVVLGWVWMSALGPRTCAACFALHGTFHTNDEQLTDHVQGRCSPVPKTKSWAEMGFGGIPDTRTAIETGETIFGRLTAVEQREILGDSAYRAFKDGSVTLRDFVGVKDDAEWGPMHYRRSLTEILGNEASRYQKPVQIQRRRAA